MTDVTNTKTALVIPGLKPVYTALDDVAMTAFRIVTGLFLVPHGAQKLFGMFGGYGLEATGDFFQTQLGFSNGYLAALGAGSVEFFAGLALAFGLFTRFAAGAIVVMLAVAASFHLGAGFFWTSGGWEYPVLWLVAAAVFVVKGGGAYSVDRAIGREL